MSDMATSYKARLANMNARLSVLETDMAQVQATVQGHLDSVGTVGLPATTSNTTTEATDGPENA